MTDRQAFYSIVQYQPDPSRLESVNIGVVVFCAQTQDLAVRLSSHSRRVTQFFGHHDLRFLQKAKKALEEGLKRECPFTLEGLQTFSHRLSNALRMTDMRSVRIRDIGEGADNLFVRLVEEQVERRSRVQKILGDRLAAAGVADYIQKTVQVDLKQLGQPLRVPFAYRNGRLNLISPIEFTNPRDMLTKVGEKALQGELLRSQQHPSLSQSSSDAHLVVVAQYPASFSDAMKGFVAQTFQNRDIGLYTFDNLDPLILDIKHAKEMHSKDGFNEDGLFEIAASEKQ
jgi:hypothetical protein